MPETASNSESLTPLHLEGRDNRFSKLRALKEEVVWQFLSDKSWVHVSIIWVTYSPDRNTLDAPHAVLISVDSIEDIRVLLETLLLLQLKKVFFPGHSPVAEVKHSTRGVDIKPVE